MELNIVGLIICVPEFIWTVINFFLLLFLLKKFLYTPILGILDERKANVEAGLNEGKAAEKALSDNERVMQSELAESGNAAREKIGQAKAEAEKAKGAVLAQAHTEAAALQNELRRRVDEDEKTARSSLDAAMPELVELLTSRLLHTDGLEGTVKGG